MITVGVLLGSRSYDVLVGPGVRRELATMLPARATRAAIVTQPAVGVAVETGITQRTFEIGEGEPAKSLATVESLCRAWASWGLGRADVVVAVGGGVVCDTAGFAAAVYHRGVALVNVATTLLAQVDAAIGGKTGVNLPEGKNLVGAFWQPAGVLCDTETLATLSPREHASGRGEMAKYHFLTEDRLDELDLDERIARCATIKAEVVASDERENGRRALLNYGHTLAHALETAGHYDLRHGEAVGIGLVFAARLAHRLGRIDRERVDEHVRLVKGYELPTGLPASLDPDVLVTLMSRDKKAMGGLTFVLDGAQGPELVRDVTEQAVRETLAELQG